MSYKTSGLLLLASLCCWARDISVSGQIEDVSYAVVDEVHYIGRWPYPATVRHFSYSMKLDDGRVLMCEPENGGDLSDRGKRFDGYITKSGRVLYIPIEHKKLWRFQIQSMGTEGSVYTHTGRATNVSVDPTPSSAAPATSKDDPRETSRQLAAKSLEAEFKKKGLDVKVSVHQSELVLDSELCKDSAARNLVANGLIQSVALTASYANSDSFNSASQRVNSAKVIPLAVNIQQQQTMKPQPLLHLRLHNALRKQQLQGLQWLLPLSQTDSRK